MKKIIKQLTPRDAVLGIGRKATRQELNEYLNRPRKEEFKSIEQIRDEITGHLRRRNQKRKAS
jgi:2-succinyl-5-enolpyruvyl-6-hydroxy-3-cyclohexene-1-carboxylate synthase